MELRHLRHLAAVIELENVSKAAVLLAISQPALTRSIQMLEDIVGAQLIERRPRGVVPTAAGEAMYRHAKLILSEARRAKEDVAAIRRGAGGRLRVGIASMFAQRIVDEAVIEFSAEHTDARITVTEGYFEELLSSLQEGRLDLVFCNLPGSVVPEGLYAEPVLDVRAIILANSDHPLARKVTVTRAELAEARWAVVNQPHMKDYLDHFFAVQGLQLQRPPIQTNSLGLIQSLLAHGAFVTMLPEFLAQPDLAAGRLSRLKTPGGEVLRQAGIIRRVNSTANAADGACLTNFVAILRRICGGPSAP